MEKRNINKKVKRLTRGAHSGTSNYRETEANRKDALLQLTPHT